MLSSRMTTSCWCSTNRLAFSMTMSATCTCRVGGSSKVELTTSPSTERIMSVTSSGRSSMRRTMSVISGWFLVMALAIFCRSMVLPVNGGATIMPRWPLPMGVRRFMMRVEMSCDSYSRSMRSSGCSGVRLSNRTFCFATSGSSKLMASTRMSAKYFSSPLGGRICPDMVSPVRRLKRLICEWPT